MRTRIVQQARIKWEPGNKTVVKLVKAEDRKIGAVGLKTLIAYYDAASNGKNGILFCFLSFLCLLSLTHTNS